MLIVTAEETRGTGKCHVGTHRAGSTVSDEGGGASPRSRGVRDLEDLLADAVDRVLVAGQSSGLAVRRLDPVAVELLVGRDRARGEVERRGARVRFGVDEDGAALGAVEVAARARRRRASKSNSSE